MQADHPELGNDGVMGARVRTGLLREHDKLNPDQIESALGQAAAQISTMPETVARQGMNAPEHPVQQHTLSASEHAVSGTRQPLAYTPKTDSLTGGSQQLHEATYSVAIIPAFATPEKLHKATPKDVVPVIHEHQAAHRAASPLLKEGSYGNEVMEAQKKLHALHYKGPDSTDLKADKIFGRATEFAVRNFQKENGLTADGLIGPKTHEALNSPTAKAAPDMSRSEFAEKKAAQVPEPLKTPFNAEAYWHNIIRTGTQTSTGQQANGEHIAQDQTQTQDQNRSMGLRR